MMNKTPLSVTYAIEYTLIANLVKPSEIRTNIVAHLDPRSDNPFSIGIAFFMGGDGQWRAAKWKNKRSGLQYPPPFDDFAALLSALRDPAWRDKWGLPPLEESEEES